MTSARAVMLIGCLSLSGCALSHEVCHDGGGTSIALAPCASSMAGPDRDCGWMLVGTYSCTPGGFVAVGCDISCGLGSCTGDSMIRVCPDACPCLARDAIGADDDSPCGGGLCSMVRQATCPASGHVTVMTGPFSSGSAYTCNIAVR